MLQCGPIKLISILFILSFKRWFWVTRTQYCLLTEVASQFTRSRECKRNEKSHWPQNWHWENIPVFASINKLPLHCTCNTKVSKSNVFALKRIHFQVTVLLILHYKNTKITIQKLSKIKRNPSTSVSGSKNSKSPSSSLQVPH